MKHLSHNHLACRTALAVLAALVAVAARAGAQPAVKENQLKAAFVYNFTMYAEWPEESFPDATAAIVLGVLGPRSFQQELETTVAGRRVNGRALEVRAVSRPEDVNGVHVLFVSSAAETRLADCLAALKGRPILTVGESAAFNRLGGMITLVVENEKLRFDINLAEAEASRLKLRAQLLKLARNVRRPSPS